jgi:tetratricopeptide (TPR) repeat protein
MKAVFSLLLCLCLLIPVNAVPSPVETGAAHRALAGVLEGKKDYAGAIGEYQKAYALDTDQHLPEAALDLNSIGEALYAQNRYAEALGYFQQALALTHGTGGKNEAIALNDLAMTQDSLGKREEGLAALKQSLAILRALGDRPEQANTLGNVGTVLQGLGRMEEAVAAWDEALDILHALPVGAEEKLAGNLAAELYDAKQYAAAAKFYSRLLVCQRTRGDDKGVAATLTNLGTCADNLHQYSQAADFYVQAVPLWHAEKDAAGEQEVVSRLASALFDAARYSETLVTRRGKH